MDSSVFFPIHRAWAAFYHAKALLQARPRQHNPQHFPNTRTGPGPFCTSDPHGCAQQSLQQVLVPGWQAAGQRAGACARRPAPGRGSGLGPDDIARDGGHRMLAARPAGQAARAPSRLPAVTRIVILPAAPPDMLKLPGLRRRRRWPPRLRDHDHEPEREAPVPIDDRVQQAITGQQRPTPGHWAQRRPCSRRRGTRSCGLALRRSCTGLLPARRLRRSLPPARRGGPGTSPVLGRTPDHRGRHSRGCRGCRPWQRRSCRAESGTAPPCMRWRGPARPRRADRPAPWSSPRAARRPPGPGTRARGRSPGSSRVPGRRPRVVPVSSGESISTASASTAQGPAAGHFLFFRYPRRNAQKAGSYPHFTAVIHGFIHSLPTGCRVDAGEHLNRCRRMQSADRLTATSG